MTPEETYRAEKAKRAAVAKPVLAPLAGNRHDGRKGRRVRCPKCKSERFSNSTRRGVLAQRRYGTAKAEESTSVTCADCGYRWRTAARDAFGHSRVVEVRG